MKSILVTGGAGFIGTNLCLRLLEQGHKVFCIDNLMVNKKIQIENKNFIFIEKDIVDVKNFDHHLDEIYHLACPASPPIYQNNPIHTIQTCVTGTINICNIAKDNKCPILLTSTSEVYGEPQITPQSECYRGNVSCIGPRACYDEGKRMAETIMFEYKRLFDLDIKVCRIFNTYGPYLCPKDGRVISNFIDQILNGQHVTIYGDGSQTRSFCYVDDLVDGLLKLMQSSVTGPINLGNPNEISILELIRVICGILKVEPKLVYMELPKDDPTNRCPDIGKAFKLLDWKPSTDLVSGLEKTISYYLKILKNENLVLEKLKK